MTQYVKAAVAFGSVASYLAQNASPGATDLRDLFFRCSQKVSIGKGTLRYGTILSLNTNERYMAIPDDVYAALVAAGVDFSDALYNSSVSPGATSSTSEILSIPNFGTHRMAMIVIGSSIPNGKIGAGTYKEFALQANQWWSQAVDRTGKGAVYVAPASLPVTAPGAPEYAYSKVSAHEKSCMTFNFGHDSWRIADLAGFNYQTPVAQTGSPHLDNVLQFAKMIQFAGQTRVYDFRSALTNDFEYGLRNSNPGLGSTPSGGTWSGSPNSITDCIVPTIAAIKAFDPTGKIRIWGEMCRTSTVNNTRLNQSFGEEADYIIANKASLGVDQFIDMRFFTQTDSRTPSNATNTTYFQDGTHPTPLLVSSILSPMVGAANDALLGFTPDPTFAGAIH